VLLLCGKIIDRPVKDTTEWLFHDSKIIVSFVIGLSLMTLNILSHFFVSTQSDVVMRLSQGCHEFDKIVVR